MEHLYVDVLGMEVRDDSYSPGKKRRKIELFVDVNYVIEVFIYDDSALFPRTDEMLGFDHLSFLVEDIEAQWSLLIRTKYKTSELMMDDATGMRYAFFYNQDGVKHEIYEKAPWSNTETP